MDVLIGVGIGLGAITITGLIGMTIVLCIVSGRDRRDE